MRKCFEFGVMSGDQRRASRFKEMIEDRARQRRAFLRISTRAELIKNHERALIDLFEDTNDVRDMTAEGAERLFDGLLVPDIRIDRMEAGQLRTALRGNVQSALCHECEQTNCFQRNCFATRVRTGDDYRAGARLGIDIDGNDSLWIKQRMAGIFQAD